MKPEMRARSATSSIAAIEPVSSTVGATSRTTTSATGTSGTAAGGLAGAALACGSGATP